MNHAVKCEQEKLGETGFEFSDKLAPGGGDELLLHGKPSFLRFASIVNYFIGLDLSME